MKLHHLILATVGSFLISGGAASADDARTWTSTSGTELSAELVSAADGKVVLKTAGGRVLNLRLDQLSKADRDYLADLEKRKSAASAGKAGDEAKTVMDPDAWYAGGFQEDDVFVTELLLKAGESRDFDAPAYGREEVYIGFSAKEGLDIQESYKKKNQDDPYAIQLISRSDKNETLSTNIGGGMSWTAKSGKVRFKIMNHSEIDTRVVIKTRKGDH